MARADEREGPPRHRYLFQLFHRNIAGAEAVIDVVVVIGDVIGERRDLAFERWKGVEAQILNRHVGADGKRQTVFGVALDGAAFAIDQGAIVLNDAFERLPGEVHAAKRRVTVFE